MEHRIFQVVNGGGTSFRIKLIIEVVRKVLIIKISSIIKTF